MSSTTKTLAWILVALVLGFFLPTFFLNEGRDSKNKSGLSQTQFVDQADLTLPAAKSNGPRTVSARFLRKPTSPAMPNERLVRFKDEEAFRRALETADKNGIKLLGEFPHLNAVRIHFDTLADLADFVGDDGEEFFNYISYLPAPPERTGEPGAVGFGASALSYMGVNEDNIDWGRGVKVAVLDSGIEKHLDRKSVV